MSARTRRKMVRCGAVHSKKLAKVSSDAERLYWRIYMTSDNFGTMQGDPFDVKSEAAPMVQSLTEAKVGKALDDLVEIGLLQRWSSEGHVWVNVIGHDEIQSPDFIRKRGMRKTPVPPETPDCEPKAGVLCPSGEFSAPLLSISTSTKTTNTSSSENDLDLGADKEPNPVEGEVTQVLHHWKQTYDKPKSAITGPKAKSRRSRVRSRLSEGWTVDELKKALDGHWTRDIIKSNPQYHRIETVLRDSTQVEAGIDQLSSSVPQSYEWRDPFPENDPFGEEPRLG